MSDHFSNYIFLSLLEGTDSKKELLFSEHENKGNSGKHSFQLWQTEADFRYRIEELEQFSSKKQLHTITILQMSSLERDGIFK